jgi:hypothetical protein
MILIRSFYVVIVVLLILMSSTALQATPTTLTLTLSNTSLQGAPGSVIDVQGTITNSGPDDVFITSDSYTSPASEFSFDDSAFLTFLFAPNSYLVAGSSTQTDLFTIAISSMASSGFIPLNSFGITGQDALTSDVLSASANFDVTVGATPEPPSFLFMLTGMLVITFVSKFVGVSCK